MSPSLQVSLQNSLDLYRQHLLTLCAWPHYSLVLDRDVNEDLALLYPELYKDLVKVSRKAQWRSSTVG
jgi:hypothetical protein